MQTPGPLEIIVILVIALLVFGPNKLPEIGKQVGKAVREFKRFQASFNEEVRDFVDPDKPVPDRWAGNNGAPATAAHPPSQTPTQAPAAPPPPAQSPAPEVVDAEIVTDSGATEPGEGGTTSQPTTT